uniref:Diguanylate cyclase n=1 Tax=Ascaris lumbricoides TaxID=6252 RepID=A0A0M3HIL1_ASCLU
MNCSEIDIELCATGRDGPPSPNQPREAAWFAA